MTRQQNQGAGPQQRPARASKAKGPAAAKSGERLQKILARCGVSSRRAAEELIAQGRVDVNGVTVTELGVRVDPLVDDIRLDGERLKMPEARLVLVLNKPVGYLSAASDPEGRPLVYHLMPKGLALRSIGRLDFNTEGVLLFTNDGDLAERLGHARYNVQRVYEARVRGIPSEETLAKLRMGVRLEDGPARAEQVEIVKQTEHNAWLRLTLTEGRNREVRRLLERVGHPVVRLRRVSFAGVTTLGCKLGEYRALDELQVAQLLSRGHVGAFELPPDPRKRREAPVGLSTGPTPDRAPPRRGEGRAEVTERRPAAPKTTPADKGAGGEKPARKKGSAPRGGRGRDLDLPLTPRDCRPRRPGAAGPGAGRAGQGRTGQGRAEGGGAKPAAPRGRGPAKPGAPRGGSKPSGPTRGR